MSPIDIYEMLVGEIGVERRAFLCDMRYWEIRRVVRGYGKRLEKTLTNTRMLAYLITSYNGMTDLRKAGVMNAHDFWPLPWDKPGDGDGQPSDEEVETLRRQLRDYNRGVSSGQAAT